MPAVHDGPQTGGDFPLVRMRRNRGGAAVRRLVAENLLTAADLIQPLFLIEGQGRREAVPSMPGVARLSVDLAVEAARQAWELGIPGVALFPCTDPAKKTADGSEALNPGNLVCRALRGIRAACPDMMLICDVALDPYTNHGHDGLLRNGVILNDETVEVLTRQAVVQAAAGCDTVAPSDMMDGRIRAIRTALDAARHADVRILSYAAKYASVFYGPFRDAVGSSGALKGDKRSYQMDPANGAEALREVAMDLREGADMVMVKPGMPYLDVIRQVKNTFPVPVLAYQVSGEYAMIKAAAAQGWLDGDAAMMEALLAFKRAGADGIFSYFATVAAQRLQKG